MNRRDAVARVALLMGGTIIGAEFILTGCSPSASNKPGADQNSKNPSLTTAETFQALNPEQTAYLTEVADTILPATKTPGAKAANVGSFMAVMVRDCYALADQNIFMEGLKKLEAASDKMNSKGFIKSTPAERTALLTALDKEQKEYSKTKKPEDPNHYFRMMKELSMLGFFTSEIGATQALRYVAVPGKYDGNVPYKKGDRAWATS
ncbi:MAG: gluconate 2-dehydrogenase subunit 3 family protein [Janthinobacterium lividum]